MGVLTALTPYGGVDVTNSLWFIMGALRAPTPHGGLDMAKSALSPLWGSSAS